MEVMSVIRHNVLFRLKESTTEKDLEMVFHLLAQLKNVLPGFIRVASGECAFHGKAYHVNERIGGFSIDFENAESYKAFLNSPLANPAKECILKITEGGMSGLYGFDMGGTFNPEPSGPNPLDKYRVPRPRLVPRGYK